MNSGGGLTRPGSSVKYRAALLLAAFGFLVSCFFAVEAIAVSGSSEVLSIAFRLYYLASPVLCGFLIVRGIDHGEPECRHAIGYFIGSMLVPLTPWMVIALMLVVRPS